MLACCRPTDKYLPEAQTFKEERTPGDAEVLVDTDTRKPAEPVPIVPSIPAASEIVEEEEDTNDDVRDPPEDELVIINRWMHARSLSNKERKELGYARQKVFSECVDWDAPYTPPIHKKTDKQVQKLSTDLEKCWIFSALNEKKFAAIIAAFKRQKYEKGATIFKQGELVTADDPGIFLVEKGTCDVAIQEPGTSNTVNKQVKDGDIFGELSLLHSHSRPSTVVANTTCSMWSLHRGAFTNIVLRSEREVKMRLQELVAKVEVFQSLCPTDLNRVVDAMETRMVDVGTKIVVEGEIGDKFFIIKEGKCVAVKGDLVVKEYVANDYFGELALLNDEPRAATIMSVSKTELATLHKDVLKRLLGNNVDLLNRRNTYQDEEIDAPGEESSSSDSEMDDEEVARREKARSKGARMSVLGDSWTHDPNWVGPHFPKTPEQRARLAEVLSQSFIFQALSQADINRVIDAFREHQAKLNDVIIVQGDEVGATEPGLYVIEGGHFNVYKSPTTPLTNVHVDVQPGTWCGGGELRPLNPEQVKDKFGPHVFTYETTGQYFGELALLYNAPRAASVIASSQKGVMWSISRDVFNNVVKGAMMLEKQRCEKVLEDVPLLQHLSYGERTRIADAMSSRSIKKGEYIIRKGEAGQELYILEEGQAVASLDGRVVRQYMANDFFGERALLKKEPRAADVIALIDCRVLLINRECFVQLLGPLEKVIGERVGSYDNLG